MDPKKWPARPEQLIDLQRRLGAAHPPPWQPRGDPVLFGGCFVCFGRGGTGPGQAGDRGWAAAVLWRAGSVVAGAHIAGLAPAPYEPGLLALREGPLLAAAIERLPRLPDVLLVDATGRDHPRRAGLALHLGWAFDVPSVGITHRPLLATGQDPGPRRGDRSPLTLDGELVGYFLRTKAETRPLAVHAAWRTDATTAVDLALLALDDNRTPEPLREARMLARVARAADMR